MLASRLRAPNPTGLALSAALALLAGCQQGIDVEVRLPSSAFGADGELLDGLALEGAVRRGSACPDADEIVSGDAGAALAVIVGDHQPVVLLAGDYVVTMLVRDDACQVRYFGCTAFHAGDAPVVAVTGEVYASPLACGDEQVCDASRCRDLGPSPDPEALVTLCGHPPGSWSFGPATIEPRMTVGPIDNRYPALFEAGGLHRIVASPNEDHGGDFDLYDADERTISQPFGSWSEEGRFSYAPATALDAAFGLYHSIDRDTGGTSIMQIEIMPDGTFGPYGLAIADETDRAWREPWPTDDGTVIWYAEGVTAEGPRDLHARSREGRFFLLPLSTAERFDLSALNTPYDERAPTLSRTENLLIFSSDRDGSYDLFASVRAGDAFHSPVRLDALSEPSRNERDPFLYDVPGDACGLYFAREGPGGLHAIMFAPVIARP